METKQSLSDNIHVPGPHSFWVLRFVAQYFPLCVCVLVAQSCPTLWDLMDCNLPGSSLHESLQARIQEWVTISFSKGSFEPGSPELQADSLPSEPPGKPPMFSLLWLKSVWERGFLLYNSLRRPDLRWLFPSMGTLSLWVQLIVSILKGWERTGKDATQYHRMLRQAGHGLDHASAQMTEILMQPFLSSHQGWPTSTFQLIVGKQDPEWSSDLPLIPHGS